MERLDRHSLVTILRPLGGAHGVLDRVQVSGAIARHSGRMSANASEGFPATGAEDAYRPNPGTHYCPLSDWPIEYVPMPDADAFHNAYRVFVHALGMLATSADEQCTAMGDYNVAWELKDDVQAGKFLIGKGHMDAVQEAWISTVVCALDAIPAATLSAGAGRAVNLTAMCHPSWIPLRVFAGYALEALSAATAGNSRFLDLP